jgi:hypothetical protein
MRHRLSLEPCVPQSYRKLSLEPRVKRFLLENLFLDPVFAEVIESGSCCTLAVHVLKSLGKAPTKENLDILYDALYKCTWNVL